MSVHAPCGDYQLIQVYRECFHKQNSKAPVSVVVVSMWNYTDLVSRDSLQQPLLMSDQFCIVIAHMRVVR